jgi:hypothetical protein
MYKVVYKFKIADRWCVDVEGDTQYLKNGIKLKDEKGNVFVIQSIAIVDHKNMEYYKKYALLLLIGEIENIGKNLTIVA